MVGNLAASTLIDELNVSPLKEFDVRWDLIPLIQNEVLPLVIFFWGLYKYYKFFKKGFSSYSWPTTEGTINTSYVARVDRSYKPIIKYSYSVMGTQYYYNQIYIGSTGISGMKWGANRTVGRHPVGKKAIVYYDPTNPDQAILEPGIKWTLAIFWLMASPLLFMALGFQLFFWLLPLMIILFL